MVLSLIAGLLFPECSARGQRYRDFITPTPLQRDEILVLGFMGGRDTWDNDQRGVRQLALKLRARKLPGVHLETVENKKRGVALELIHNAFHRDRNGTLDEAERRGVRLILYGHSFGGAAVVKLARQLQKMSLPVLLSIQIDSVGRNDALIPPNVRRAANLFQGNGIFIRGEPEIRAEDARKTTILGNFNYDYRHKKIDISHVSWFKKSFRVAHTKMGHDPEVWTRVERLILEAIDESREKRTGGE